MTSVLFAHKKISVYTRAWTTNEWDALRHTWQREMRNARGRQASNGLSRFVDVADTPIGERRGAALQRLAMATLSPSLSYALYTGVLARYIFPRTRVLPATMRVNPVFAPSWKSTARTCEDHVKPVRGCRHYRSSNYRCCRNYGTARYLL